MGCLEHLLENAFNFDVLSHLSSCPKVRSRSTDFHMEEKRQHDNRICLVFAKVVPEHSGLSHQDIQHWSSSQNEMHTDLYPPPHPKDKRLKSKVIEVDER